MAAFRRLWPMAARPRTAMKTSGNVANLDGAARILFPSHRGQCLSLFAGSSIASWISLVSWVGWSLDFSSESIITPCVACSRRFVAAHVGVLPQLGHCVSVVGVWRWKRVDPTAPSSSACPCCRRASRRNPLSMWSKYSLGSCCLLPENLVCFPASAVNFASRRSGTGVLLSVVASRLYAIC